MKRFLILAIIAMAAFGCQGGGEMSKSEEAKFKETLEAGNKPFDINNVPPEQRERVRALMQQNAAPASAQGVAAQGR